MNIIFDGVSYSEGDKVQFKEKYRARFPNQGAYVGEIKFGEYKDDEEYSTIYHLGFYVEYEEDGEVFQKTLPDIIRFYNGRKLV